MQVWDYLGKVWNLPNTLIGLVFAIAGTFVGFGLGRPVQWRLGWNCIQITGSPLVTTAITLGNVVIYGVRVAPEHPNRRLRFTPHGYTVAHEEYMHTLQGQILGPLYLPVHIVCGLWSCWHPPHPQFRCRVDRWHQANAMEIGPMQGRIF